MQPIQSVGALPPVTVRASVGAPMESTGGPSFKDMLANSLEQLTVMPRQAPVAAGDFSSGGEHAANMLLATQRADSTIQSAMQVGERLVAAYNEIKDLRI
jgi:flagellar hook-basal body complex protein FliE